MVLHPLRLRTMHTLSKALVEIRAGAEDPPMPRHNDAFHAVVGVKHGVRVFDLGAHRVREGIVVVGAVQGEDDDGGLGGVVARLDLREGEGVVGAGEGDVGRMAGRLLGACHCEVVAGIERCLVSGGWVSSGD